MKPDPLRPLLGGLGLLIGFALYGAAGKLAEPAQSLVIGAMFALLGVTAFLYARGERWIQVLGALLFGYGLLRAFVLH